MKLVIIVIIGMFVFILCDTIVVNASNVMVHIFLLIVIQVLLPNDPSRMKAEMKSS